MSAYPVPPPSYTRPSDEETPLVDVDAPCSAESEPLLAGNAHVDVDDSDVPDDFKYGTTVSDSAPQIRKAFIRKVYSILLLQILTTMIIAGVLSQTAPAVEWVLNHLWAFFVPLIGTLVNLILLQWKRHSHPLNLVLLSSFTILEAYVLGIAVAHYDNHIILQALAITFAVFLALTIFTFNSKYDFSGMAPYLLSSLIVLLTASMIHFLVLPFNRTMDTVLTVGGCLIFSAFIVFDTYSINKRLSPDEFVLGAISLYLDFVNLFLRILRLS